MQIHIPHIGHTVFIKEVSNLDQKLGTSAEMSTTHTDGERETTVSLLKGRAINLPCLIHEFVHVSQFIFKEYSISYEEMEHQAYLVQFLLNEWLIKKDISPIIKS